MPLIEINDQNWTDHDEHVGDDGEMRSKGLVPRDFDLQPHGMMGAEPFPDALLVDDSEIDDRIRQQEINQNSMQHIRDIGMNGSPMPSLDQNGKGYCWFHSGTNCMRMARAIMGLPYVELSAYMGACLIKNYRDQGGNGIEGIRFMGETGVCSTQFWPAQSMSRGNDTPEMRANAALHKAMRWYDLSENASQRKRQVMACLLRNIPLLGDFNWWGHSVMMLRLLSRTKTRIWNSWSDSWSQNGVGDLADSRAWPDNAVALLTESASVT